MIISIAVVISYLNINVKLTSLPEDSMFPQKLPDPQGASVPRHLNLLRVFVHCWPFL